MRHKTPFWGREQELADLRDWDGRRSKLVTIYGRRRVGKTRLVEEAFRDFPLLKIEGVEGGGQAEQKRFFLHALADFCGRIELKHLRPGSWSDTLTLLSAAIGDRTCVVLLDEFQWLASGRTKLVSHLKHAWDNHFIKNNKILLILCGSVSSFMVKRVLRSKALYGRVTQEIHLQPLSLRELQPAVSPLRSIREAVELYMVIGGVPLYWEMVDFGKSFALNVERLCFRPNGFLVNEFERLFASHFGSNTRYRDILISLAKRGFAGQDRIKKDCRIDSGGRLSEYLENLELAGFIESYPPVDRSGARRNLRYRLCDPYLLFYFRFIHNERKRIERADRHSRLHQFLPDRKLNAWQGLAFEQFCYSIRGEIAATLGFGGIRYEAGPWYQRSASQENAQIDLVYLRSDHVITMCEMKFTDKKVGLEVTTEMARKLDIFPNPRNHTIEKVLVTAAPPTKQLEDSGYFHAVIELNDLLG